MESVCAKAEVDCNLKYHLHQLLINIFVMSTVYIGEFHKTSNSHKLGAQFHSYVGDWALYNLVDILYQQVFKEI